VPRRVTPHGKARRTRVPPPAAATGIPVAFVELLRGLKPSGSDGFEGWAADALSEVTGRVFRLVKPGPQGGADLLSGTAAGEALLAVEVKRFREDTQLPLDDLLAKVADLAQTRPEADLWMLAATRQIPAEDVAKPGFWLAYRPPSGPSLPAYDVPSGRRG